MEQARSRQPCGRLLIRCLNDKRPNSKIYYESSHIDRWRHNANIAVREPRLNPNVYGRIEPLDLQYAREDVSRCDDNIRLDSTTRF